MSMKFSIWGIIFMMIAIGIGSLLGSLIASFMGLAGGIIGTIVSGFAVYLIYAVISGMPIKLMAGLIFAIFVWIANMLAGMISGFTGLGGGIIGLGVTAIIMSFIWGNFGAGLAGSPIGTATTSKKRSSRRRKGK